MLHQVATQDLLGHAEPTQRLRNFSFMSLALAGSGFSGPLIAGLAIDHLAPAWPSACSRSARCCRRAACTYCVTN